MRLLDLEDQGRLDANFGETLSGEEDHVEKLIAERLLITTLASATSRSASIIEAS